MGFRPLLAPCGWHCPGGPPGEEFPAPGEEVLASSLPFSFHPLPSKPFPPSLSSSSPLQTPPFLPPFPPPSSPPSKPLPSSLSSSSPLQTPSSISGRLKLNLLQPNPFPPLPPPAAAAGGREELHHPHLQAAAGRGRPLGADQRPLSSDHLCHPLHHRHRRRLRDAEEAEPAPGAGGLQALVEGSCWHRNLPHTSSEPPSEPPAAA